MNIGGLQETSLLDYPGNVSAIIWTTGCNFRCPFCYNPDLVQDTTDHVSEDMFFSFLNKRKGKLDAVSISGGEPFLQADLKEFIYQIKQMGFNVKIDTNGCFPTKLEKLLDEQLVDYVSMDVKTTKKQYNRIAGIDVDVKTIDASIKLIMDRAPDYEFKTTVIPEYHTEKEIIEIARWITGSTRYILQQFKSDTVLLDADAMNITPYSRDVLLDLCEKTKPYVKKCKVRGI